MNGWKGKILHINLNEKKISIITPGSDIYLKFIGGKGLAGYFLRPAITLSYDDPDMPLLFFTGPLVDTPSPTSGRMTIMSRSPLTGTVGDTSVGGGLGSQIKRAGWDGIIITGASRTLCGINISNENVVFTDASLFAGMTISDLIGNLPEGGSYAAIGPAAEHGVMFSCISVDRHFAAGRNGLGCVMAAKGIKYIHVIGNGKTGIYNRGELDAAREEIARLVSASPILKGEFGISEFGTGSLFDLMASRRMMPTDNFRKTWFSESPSLNAWQYKKKYDPKKVACHGCYIACKKATRSGESLPEFETMSHFSALIGNANIEEVFTANSLCNDLGMDTITAAATIACYLEIENRSLKPGELHGLLHDIAFSRGVGAELKKGSARYAASIGKPGIAMAVKGLEMSAYDPRGAYGMALAYATSTRGACHLRAYPISHEILRKPVATDRFSFSGKARIIKLTEDTNAVVDSLTACKFIFFAASLEEFAKVYTAVTGYPTTAQDLLYTGERIYYHERIMNALNGFASADDDLPLRFFSEPGSGGEGIEVPPINREEFLETRAHYYEIRGLDNNGIPSEKKSGELGLKWKN